MRGSGKTQLAAAVAARCEEEGWPLVAWIHAASRKEILANLYEVALRFGMTHRITSLWRSLFSASWISCAQRWQRTVSSSSTTWRTPTT